MCVGVDGRKALIYFLLPLSLPLVVIKISSCYRGESKVYLKTLLESTSTSAAPSNYINYNVLVWGEIHMKSTHGIEGEGLTLMGFLLKFQCQHPDRRDECLRVAPLNIYSRACGSLFPLSHPSEVVF